MSGNLPDFTWLISELILVGPILLLAAIGVTSCVVRKSRPLRVRVAVCAALAWEAVASIAGTHAWDFTMTVFESMGTPETQELLVRWFWSAVHAAGVAVLLWATFTGDQHATV